MCRIRPCDKAAPCGAALCLYSFCVRFSADGRSRVFCRDMPCFFGRIDETVRHGERRAMRRLCIRRRWRFAGRLFFSSCRENRRYSDRAVFAVSGTNRTSPPVSGIFRGGDGRKIPRGRSLRFRAGLVRAVGRCATDRCAGDPRLFFGRGGTGRCRTVCGTEKAERTSPALLSECGRCAFGLCGVGSPGANPSGRSRGSRSAWQWPTGRRPDRCVRPKRGLPWPVRPVRPAACSWR